MKHLVLLGGGHAHIQVLTDLALRPHELWMVTLVTPFPWLTYSGMVPGHIAGHYTIEECTIDIAGLAARALAETRWTVATRIDAMARKVICASGPPVPYDLLSIDVGSLPANMDVPGVAHHAVPMRPLERAVKGWNEVLSRARDGKVGAITVAGGGAAGIETALAMESRLRAELGANAPHVRVVSDTARAVPEFAYGARRRLQKWLRRRGIGLHLANAVTEVGPGFVRTGHGFEFVSDAVFWAAGSAPHPWIRGAGFTTDDRGYLLTNDFLQSVSHPEVFGAGDCATQQVRGYPKAGVFAVRAGPILANNLRVAIAGGEMQAHASSRRYLALVSTGKRHAVGVWGGVSWEGDWVWRWKDRIDRSFVARFAPPAS